MQKKWLKIITVFILFFYFGGLYYLYQMPFNICIRYEIDNDSEAYSQLFYTYHTEKDMESMYVWNESEMYAVNIVDDKAVFTIPKEIFDNINIFRLDPIGGEENELEIAIKNIVLYKGCIPIKTISAYNFQNRIIESCDVSINFQDNVLNIVAGVDPQMIFLNDFNLKWAIALKGGEYLLILVGVILSISYVMIFMNETYGESIFSYFRNKPRRYIWVLVSLFSFMILVLFWNYLTGKYFWFFDGIASDSYEQVYPNYYNFARRIEEKCNVAGWNFWDGMGNSVTKISPFNINRWILFRGRDSILYLNGINYVLKLFVAGLFFYKYLELLGRKHVTCLIGSIGYAFCGHMILRGRWEFYSAEVLLLAILVFCCALYIIKKDIRWLPLVLVICALSTNTYRTLLYGILFIGYMIFRYCLTGEFSIRVFLKYIGGIMFSVLLALPSMVGKVDGFIRSVSHSRFTSGVEDVKSSILEKENLFAGWDQIQSAFFQTMGIGIVGVEPAEFFGVENILNDPTFYCGIFTIIALPCAFRRGNKKNKFCYYGALGIAALYFFVTPLRTIANGMNIMGGFRLSSFWIIILFLFIGTEGMDNIWNGQVASKKIYLSAGALLVIGILLAVFVNKKIEVHLFLCACIFCVIYSIVITFYLQNDNEKIRRKIKVLTVFLCAGEVIVFTYGYINTSHAIRNKKIKNNVFEALEYIAENEVENAYRIDKTWQDFGNCDSLFYGYMGTRSYNGGTNQSVDMVEMYTDLGLPTKDATQLFGMSSSVEINTLVGVKYILKRNNALLNYGYTYKGKAGDVEVYENQYKLPLVFGYKNYISKDDFEALPLYMRRDILLKCCVIESVEENIELNYIDNDVSDKKEMIGGHTINWKWEDDIIYTDKNQDEYVLALLIEVNNKSNNTLIDILCFDDEEYVGHLQVGTPIGKNELIIPINESGVNKIQFMFDKENCAKVLSCAQIPQKLYYEYYCNSVMDLKNTGAENIELDELGSRLSGQIVLEEPAELCFTIPYNKAWKLYINGEQIETEKINIGFIGAYLEDGEYEFELKYVVNKSKIPKGMLWIGIILNIIICSYMYKKERNKSNISIIK